ncbi:MAG: RHS repeat-associated core domain-containing protein [Kiritimatiellia bacterium]
MKLTILMHVCFGGIAVLVPVCATLWLHEKGVYPLRKLMSRFRGLPWLARTLVAVFVLNLIVYGSTKSSSGPSDTQPPTDRDMEGVSPLMLLSVLEESSFESGFTDDEIAVGYALWRIGTNEVWRLAQPDGATTVDAWRLRGAVEDWTEAGICRLLPSCTFVEGDLVCSALGLEASIAPETNWPLISGTNGGSLAWWWMTPSTWRLFGWQDALLYRDSMRPLTVVAAVSRDGDILFCYDLLRAGSDVTNAVASLSRECRRLAVPLTENVTSVLFYKLRPDDLLTADRDGDGVPTWDEINTYGTDPGLADTDGDGILDGIEIANGTDPLRPSVPNAEILDRVKASATNDVFQVATTSVPDSLISLKLWDGFAAEWSESSATNVVYERTVDLGLVNGWQQFFLSSEPDGVGGWELHGMDLQWDDGAGSVGDVKVSSVGDSFHLPLTNASSSVTIRLVATDSCIRSARPMYLLSYAPVVSVDGCQTVCDAKGESLALVACRDAEHPLCVRIDRSGRPSRSALTESERNLPGLMDIEESSNAVVRYVGDEDGGELEILRTGACELPKMTVSASAGRTGTFSRRVEGGLSLILLDPSVRFEGDHLFSPSVMRYDVSTDNYAVTNCFPLDSVCLWRNWHCDATGRSLCVCSPAVTSGADDVPGVSTECRQSGDKAFGYVHVFGQLVWSGETQHAWSELNGAKYANSELLSAIGECDTCEDTCEDGRCDAVDGPSLNSVKFRLSLGSPRAHQHSGFVYFDSNEPVLVTPSLFRSILRPDAGVTVTTNNATVTYACADVRGRDIRLEPMQNGVRLTISTHATTALEYIWEIVNVDGDAATIRIREISRQGNVMRDETFRCDEDEWTVTDNVTGIREELVREDGLNDPADGLLKEWRSKYSTADDYLGSTYTESRRIGLGRNAVLRETYWREDTGVNLRWRSATYWDDAAHGARHGQARLVWGNSSDWIYRDYDENGYEILRLEQRNGSSVPQGEPFVCGGEPVGLEGIEDAWLTIVDYTPVAGDDGDSEDNGRPRCETRYVVRHGVATCIGRTWHRYTHSMVAGMPAVKHEVWRAARNGSLMTEEGNAYSYETMLSETAASVPLVLRGRPIAGRDENGVEKIRTFIEENNRLVEEVRTSFNGQRCPTYERIEFDAVHGTVLREATLLSENDVVIADRQMVYDEKNRLRSTTYADGTSETNAYSCCRLLWQEDREGRRMLRSALTGRDQLYYAEEDVWLREVSTGGCHRVVQHFMDGLGRETNVVTYVATTNGEATDWTVSTGRRLSEVRTCYPYGGSDWSEEIDARGKRTVLSVCDDENCSESLERMYASVTNGMPALEVRTVRMRGGDTWHERSWDDKWIREVQLHDYDSNGCEVRYDIVESSDYGLLTNRIVHLDFLGRIVRDETPFGTTVTAYQGASARIAVNTFMVEDIVRTLRPLYDECGDRIGSLQDGVRSVHETAYAEDADGIWWRIERDVVSGSVTNSVAEIRVRLTGFSDDGLTAESYATTVDGVMTHRCAVAVPDTGCVVTTSSNAVSGVAVRTERFGLVMTDERDDGIRRFSYDELGRQVAVTKNQETVPEESFTYGAAGDRTLSRRRIGVGEYAEERFGYDAWGRCDEWTNALGESVSIRYDAVGNVIGKTGAVHPVRCRYDTAGRRLSLATTRDGIMWDMTGWTYDPLTGKCTAKRYADDSQVTYTSTTDGLPQETRRASGAWISTRYDDRRLAVETVSSDGIANARSAYDEFGLLTSSSNAVAVYAYARHAVGLATNECMAVGNADATYVRSVDAFGRVVVRGFAGEGMQTIVYDASGRIASVSDAAATIAYSYDAEGHETGSVMTLANGLVVTRQVVRDPYRPELVRAVTNRVAGVTVDGFAYDYDALGRVVSRNADSFGYDVRGQVMSACLQMVRPESIQSTYGYDLVGNFTTVTVGTNVTDYVSNEVNQYVSIGGASSTSAVDGGQSAFGAWSLSYDADGRLVRLATSGGDVVCQGYDAFGRRVQKTSPGVETAFLYDGWNLVREVSVRTDGTDAVTDYRWGRDLSGTLGGAGGVGGLLYLARNGAIYVPLYDASGNILAYVDDTGAVVARYVYDAFGRTVASTGAQANELRFRYATKYTEPESGLVYYGYRFYCPGNGRWLSRDPLEEVDGENLYSFCRNDALNGIDCLGLLTMPSIVPDDPRAFWEGVAQVLFRGSKGWVVSADFLERALYGMSNDGPVVFGDGTEVVKRIRSSEEYKRYIDRLVKAQPSGMSTIDAKGSIEFLSGDLYAAVKYAGIASKGYVCRPSQGADRVALEVTVSDRYDFSWWKMSDVHRRGVVKSFVFAIGNNLAYLDQQMGVIHPFEWEARFKEIGQW